MNNLSILNGWGKASGYITRRSAQNYMCTNQMALTTSGCSSSCGSGNDAPKPTSACGAGDDIPRPNSACGAGDDTPKPTSACGTGDFK